MLAICVKSVLATCVSSESVLATCVSSESAFIDFVLAIFVRSVSVVLLIFDSKFDFD